MPAGLAKACLAHELRQQGEDEEADSAADAYGMIARVSSQMFSQR
jgi:hypothetical protein